MLIGCQDFHMIDYALQYKYLMNHEVGIFNDLFELLGGSLCGPPLEF